jgi:hypothetical protein
MPTKQFKVGERGYCPIYRVTVKSNGIQFEATDWEGERLGLGVHEFKDLLRFQAIAEDQTDSYHATKMVQFVESTKEYNEAMSLSHVHF